MAKQVIPYEQIVYLMFMLRANEPEYYYKWYNEELEKEDILCDLIISLSEPNMSINDIISTLNGCLLQKRCKKICDASQIMSFKANVLCNIEQ